MYLRPLKTREPSRPSLLLSASPVGLRSLNLWPNQLHRNFFPNFPTSGFQHLKVMMGTKCLRPGPSPVDESEELWVQLSWCFGGAWLIVTQFCSISKHRDHGPQQTGCRECKGGSEGNLGATG
ncbi:rCG29990 [Rattus norvegicus]|uniref:RCG29990 n=1 Tax=Rattus norvegicus TaxID=10116 RepID=A6ILY0_RAT|nr:rCG29990 [Rattus norvegicus]